MAEKDPYLITRSQPEPNWEFDHWGEEYFSPDRQKALQSIQTTKSSIVVLLNRIHKFTSHTFHVLIRELIPGAKSDKSNLFTMIKEHRNQYMIRARETRNLAPYNAKNTLDFIQDKFVKDNDNATHIAWTKILLHTRLIGQAIYQWQASFDPLIRKFEQARSKKMRRRHLTDVKQLWAKQLTDNEKIILAGINAKYSIDNVDKGTFLLKELQDDLALNTARFKGYTPDARIIAHLRTRAKEFNSELPSFLNKRQQDPRDPLAKKKFKKYQHFLTNDEDSDASPHEEDLPQLLIRKGNLKGLGKGLGKGKGKGKSGKPSTGGFRVQHHRHVAPQLSFDAPKGKGKGKGPPSSKGKGKPPRFGNHGKGDSFPPKTDVGSSSHSSITCGFCHKIGHITENCRRRIALHNNTLYQQTRNKFSGRQQLLFDDLENSVFSHDTCSWCLQSQCDGSSCSPPEEPLFYTQTNNAFCENILPLVKNAKLELPVDSSEPLSPEQFNFEDSYWGNQHSYPNDNEYCYPNDQRHASDQYAYIYDVNNDHYDQQQYVEDCGSEWQWPSYNYETNAAQASQHELFQHNEAEDGENIREGLLLEEDDDSIIYNDGLTQ
jgi:hypothetical protein